MTGSLHGSSSGAGGALSQHGVGGMGMSVSTPRSSMDDNNTAAEQSSKRLGFNTSAGAGGGGGGGGGGGFNSERRCARVLV